jgi:hypothetical protein
MLSYYIGRVHSHATFWINGVGALLNAGATTSIRLLWLSSDFGRPRRCWGQSLAGGWLWPPCMPRMLSEWTRRGSPMNAEVRAIGVEDVSWNANDHLGALTVVVLETGDNKTCVWWRMLAWTHSEWWIIGTQRWIWDRGLYWFRLVP